MDGWMAGQVDGCGMVLRQTHGVVFQFIRTAGDSLGEIKSAVVCLCVNEKANLRRPYDARKRV